MGARAGGRAAGAEEARPGHTKEGRPPDAGDVREVEEYLIREVLGWLLVEKLDGGEPTPAACWSSDHRCFTVRREDGARPRPFRPCRCLRDAWEVQAALGRDFRPYVARPVWDGNVRVVVECGSKEVVAEARSLARGLTLAIYGARQEGLV